MNDYRRTKYTQPINQAIASLSLSDLGSVADTFVAASQLLKRVRLLKSETSEAQSTWR